MLQVDTNVPVPEVGDDQVLVRVVFAGVNPVETYIREGRMVNMSTTYPTLYLRSVFSPARPALYPRVRCSRVCAAARQERHHLEGQE